MTIWNNLIFDGNEEKYDMWECKFLAHMRIKKLKKAIIPDGGRTTADEQEDAFAQLVQCLDERCLALVMRDAADNGRKALTILRNHYAGHGKPRVLSMFRKLSTIKKEEDEDLTGYLLRAENVVTTLKQAGEKFSDNLLIAAVLQGLPPSYEPFDVYVNQTVKDKKLSFLEFKRNFEENTEARGDVTEKMSVMKVRHHDHTVEHDMRKRQNDYNDKRQARGKLTCYNCGGEGHKMADCPTPSQKPSREVSEMWCHFCESSKHSYRSCKNKDVRISEADEDERRKKTYAKAVVHGESETRIVDGEAHSFLFGVKDGNRHEAQTTEEKQSALLVDSGATDHILNDKRKFVSFQPDYVPENHYLALADGTKIGGMAKGKGTARVKIRDENGRLRTSILTNVMYCPSFPCNIFSVNAATSRSKGTTVNFGADSGTLRSSDGTTFPIRKKNGLYFLN